MRSFPLRLVSNFFQELIWIHTVTANKSMWNESQKHLETSNYPCESVYKLPQYVCLFDLQFYGPVDTIRSSQMWSVILSTLFLGRLPKRLTSKYLLPILLPVTDSCPTWISGRKRMIIEIISWPNLNERYVARTEDQTDDLLNTSWTGNPTYLAGPAHSMSVLDERQ